MVYVKIFSKLENKKKKNYTIIIIVDQIAIEKTLVNSIKFCDKKILIYQI